jgi:hypothetical protein
MLPQRDKASQHIESEFSQFSFRKLKIIDFLYVKILECEDYMVRPRAPISLPFILNIIQHQAKASALNFTKAANDTVVSPFLIVYRHAAIAPFSV